MKHKFVYQLDREYRCSECGLMVNKDGTDAVIDQECPSTGDLFSISAKVDRLDKKQADIERRVLALENPGEIETPGT